jgi:hypothetical protein
MENDSSSDNDNFDNGEHNLEFFVEANANADLGNWSSWHFYSRVACGMKVITGDVYRSLAWRSNI